MVCPEQEPLPPRYTLYFVFSVVGRIQLNPGRNERPSLRRRLVGRQNRLGHHARRRSLHGHHIEHVGQLNVSARNGGRSSSAPTECS